MHEALATYNYAKKAIVTFWNELFNKNNVNNKIINFITVLFPYSILALYRK